MKRLDASRPGWREILGRHRRKWQEGQARAMARAREILSAVREEGDEAVLSWTERLDGVRLSAARLRVSRREREEARGALQPGELRALKTAAERIEAFHRSQKTSPSRGEATWVKTQGGERLGQWVRPLRRVGIYIPGGRAAYPSTVLMAGIPARLAGVQDTVLCTPPGPRGKVSPQVLVAADLAGIGEVYRIGGVQAIGAMAYGTKTLRAVDKIVGPGNAYVAAAKHLVYGDVDIDGLAGPSELLVIADGSACPRWVAADLLAQAEHDPDAWVGLIALERGVAEAVLEEVRLALPALERREVAAEAWRRSGWIIEAPDLDRAAEVVAELSPEHLSLAVRDARRHIGRFANAGAIFLGPFSPVALGDYLAGPNHVLPTGGTARFASPLGVYDFVKRMSVVEFSRSALARVADEVCTLAALEGLRAHGASVEVRFSDALPGRRRKGR